jgi:acyl-coenzyme A synthetase/AMP-(fatty) acid ligase
MDKIFLIDKNIIYYKDLINFLNDKNSNLELSDTEKFILTQVKNLSGTGIIDFKDLIDKIKKNNYTIPLNTSGTTGKPKSIIHNIQSITKNIIVNDKYNNTIWALCYPIGKMAFYQVVFQSLFNQSTIVNLFGYDFNLISDKIINNKISHISATPTFYRMLLSTNKTFYSVLQITLGGESSDKNILNKIKINFPNANIKNVYASTEAASLFASDSDIFKIPEKYKQKIKLVNNKLHLHKDLIGDIDVEKLDGEWYDTKDVIEILNDNEFRIIGRENTDINVSGFKINPFKVESAINSLEYVENSLVFSKKNSVVGNILCCNVILNQPITKLEIKNNLNGILEKYEIPSIINFVETIDINENMKISRI